MLIKNSKLSEFNALESISGNVSI